MAQKFTPSEPQKIAFDFLLKNPDSFLLMGMGLGKTSTCLKLIDHLLTNGESRGALIIAPLRVKNLTWPAEVKKYKDFQWMKMADLRTEEGQKHFHRGSADIYLINWESLPLVAKLLARKTSGKVPYDIVIADESTKGKSSESKRAATYHKYCPRVKRHIAMTGTPVPNSLLDLWGQMRFVDGGRRLGPSFNAFRDRFFDKADRFGYVWVPQENAEQRIYKRISDVTLTLKTSQYLDLPDVVLHDVDVPLPGSLMKQYRQFESDLITQVQDATINAANSAALLTKLLQFTSGAVYDEDRVSHILHDLKVTALEKTAKSINSPVLVMYGYQHELDRLRKRFPKAEFMHDAKSARAQTDLMQRWNSGRIPMLVAHPRSMAHGLNMQEGGCNIVWLTLTYSQEDYNQAIGRLFRRGQNQVVHNWRLMCPATVDWAVASALNKKIKTQGQCIEALQNLEAYRKMADSHMQEARDLLGDIF